MDTGDVKSLLYAAMYVLPAGTTASETMIIERQVQILNKLDRLLGQMDRMVQVLCQTGILESEANHYILEGAPELQYREVGV